MSRRQCYECGRADCKCPPDPPDEECPHRIPVAMKCEHCIEAERPEHEVMKMLEKMEEQTAKPPLTPYLQRKAEERAKRDAAVGPLSRSEIEAEMARLQPTAHLIGPDQRRYDLLRRALEDLVEDALGVPIPWEVPPPEGAELDAERAMAEGVLPAAEVDVVSLLEGERKAAESEFSFYEEHPLSQPNEPDDEREEPRDDRHTLLIKNRALRKALRALLDAMDDEDDE